MQAMMSQDPETFFLKVLFLEGVFRMHTTLMAVNVPCVCECAHVNSSNTKSTHSSFAAPAEVPYLINAQSEMSPGTVLASSN